MAHHNPVILGAAVKAARAAVENSVGDDDPLFTKMEALTILLAQEWVKTSNGQNICEQCVVDLLRDTVYPRLERYVRDCCQKRAAAKN
jgi:hypothetical protein